MSHATEKAVKLEKDYSSTVDLFWIVYDTNTRELLELTHKQFQEGLESNYITLRGDMLAVGNRYDKIWIDGVVK